MRKLFFAIYFIAGGMLVATAWAGTRELIDPAEITKVKNNQDISNPPQIERTNPEIPTTKEEFLEYIRERAKKATKSKQSDIDGNSGLSVIHSDEYIAQQAQNNKSTFQKIYEEALSKVTLDEYTRPLEDLRSSAPSDGKLHSQMALENLQQQSQKLGFEVINVDLPNGQTVTAPAKEHIPYLSSKIDIMPDGMVRIKDTVTVIANGQKLKYGLVKALPKYSVSRNGVKNSTIPYLNSVKINNTDIQYTIKDAFDRFLIVPKEQLPLQPGIYTYEFDYVLDRKLWYYKDFNEFYWDVTGSYWNLAVSKAIAAVRLPVNVKPLGQNLMVGFLPNDITEQGTIISINKKTNSLGFASELPLLAGEGMFMLVRIPKNGFIEPDLNKKFKWFVEDYGEMLFALLGLIMILGAYWISWKNIDRSAKDSVKISFKRTPALYRMLAKGVYDKISFGAFLIEIFQRGIINIIKENDKVCLVERDDNLSKLDYYYKKAIRQMFTQKQTTLEIGNDSSITLNKASKWIEKDTYKRLKWLLLKLNAGYVIFSCLMLLSAEFAISLLKVDTWQIFGVLVSSTITIAFYWWILFAKINNRIISIIAKSFAAVLIIISSLIMTAYVHVVSVLLIVAMIYTIFKYSHLFAKRDGLIRHNIADAKNMAEHLRNDAEQIVLGHQFAANQPNIFALGAQSAYTKNKSVEASYKMDIVEEVLKFM